MAPTSQLEDRASAGTASVADLVRPEPPATRRPLVTVAIPVFNEEAQLPGSIARLDAFLRNHCRFASEIVVANNGSTDHTREVALDLSRHYSSIHLVELRERGRGRALKRVWTESRADIVSYMDVDLSTELEAFPPMIEALIGGGYDVATGSRLLKPLLTTRGIKRELISRCYNLLVNAMFRTGFSDAQCGFKAVTRQAVDELLPLVEDDYWFMDTELLLVAERLGYRIFDFPVRWVDDPDSRVRIWRTAWDDLRGLARVRRRLRSRVRERVKYEL